MKVTKKRLQEIILEEVEEFSREQKKIICEERMTQRVLDVYRPLVEKVNPEVLLQEILFVLGENKSLEILNKIAKIHNNTSEEQGEKI